MSTENPQLELIKRIGDQMEAMQRSRAVWFGIALIGWSLSAYLYLR